MSFVVQPYRRKFIKDYCRRMSTDYLDPLWDDNVANALFDQGFEIEQSPRSIYRVSKLYEALDLYEPSKALKLDPKDSDLQNGVALAYACFSRQGDYLELKAFTPELIKAITSNLQGSSGLTALGLKKEQSYIRAYERGIQQIKGEKRPEPCIAYKRTQFEDKTRLIWGYPYSMTAIEGLFARPLINHFLDVKSPMAFGIGSGETGCRLRTSSYHKTYAYSIDISNYDSSVAKYLIHVAFNILRTWFDLDQVEPTTGVKYKEIWKIVEDYFIHTPIVMPDGNIYKGKCYGVPSGSYFTQLIDSIVNVIITGAISHRFHLHVDKDDIMVLGDDMLFWTNILVELKAIADYVQSKFHMEFNLKKSNRYKFNEPIKFLGRIWTNGMPDHEEIEISKRMAQPETFRKYAKDPAEEWAQTKLLIMSYCAVYKSAYKFFIEIYGDRRFDRTESQIEEEGLKSQDGNWFILNPDFLSGYVRYQQKYVYTNLREHTPLAIQYWL